MKNQEDPKPEAPAAAFWLRFTARFGRLPLSPLDWRDRGDDLLDLWRHWWPVILVSFVFGFVGGWIAADVVSRGSASQGGNHGNAPAEQGLAPRLAVTPNLLAEEELWRVARVIGLPCGQRSV